MKKYAIIFCVLFVTVGIIVILRTTQSPKRHIASESKTAIASRIIHSSHLFDPAFFSQAYSKGEQYKKVANQQIFGGIVPHHLLAAPLIAGFLKG